MKYIENSTKLISFLGFSSQQKPVEEAGPVINEPVILDPVIPEQPDLAPLPGLEPVPIAPEPQPQPTPSVDDLPLDDTYGM